MKDNSLSAKVATVVFSPTIMAYFLLTVRFVLWGVVLYAVSLLVAYKMNLLEQLKNWPLTSRAALFSGVALITVGIYCSTQQPSYLMAIPALAYTVLSIVGGFALTKLE